MAPSLLLQTNEDYKGTDSHGIMQSGSRAYEKLLQRVGGMIQWLRAPITPAEDLGFVLSTHTVSYRRP